MEHDTIVTIKDDDMAKYILERLDRSWRIVDAEGVTIFAGGYQDGEPILYITPEDLVALLNAELARGDILDKTPEELRDLYNNLIMRWQNVNKQYGYLMDHNMFDEAKRFEPTLSRLKNHILFVVNQLRDTDAWTDEDEAKYQLYYG